MAERLFEEVSRTLSVIGGTEETITLSRVPDYIIVDLGDGDVTFLANATILQGEGIGWDDITGGSFTGGVSLVGNTVTVGYYSGGGRYPTLTVKAYIGQVMVDDITLSNIADAIRGKNGTDEKYSPSEMAAAIEAIPTGGGGNIDALVDRSITEASGNATLIGENVFITCASLASVDFPLATKVGTSAFSGCGNLQAVNLPLVANIGQKAFNECKTLKTVNFPLVTFINGSAFYQCEKLETVDIGSTTSVSAYAFRRCFGLKAVILRSTAMSTLVATSAFLECYHILGTVNATYNPDGLKDGYIYVPRSLVDTYKANSDWATYASQFRALEDYTVGGTTTGALDESKI